MESIVSREFLDRFEIWGYTTRWDTIRLSGDGGFEVLEEGESGSADGSIYDVYMIYLVGGDCVWDGDEWEECVEAAKDIDRQLADGSYEPPEPKPVELLETDAGGTGKFLRKGFLSDRFYETYFVIRDANGYDRLCPDQNGGRAFFNPPESERSDYFYILEVEYGDIVWDGSEWEKCLEKAYCLDDDITFKATANERFESLRGKKGNKARGKQEGSVLSREFLDKFLIRGHSSRRDTIRLVDGGGFELVEEGLYAGVYSRYDIFDPDAGETWVGESWKECVRAAIEIDLRLANGVYTYRPPKPAIADDDEPEEEDEPAAGRDDTESGTAGEPEFLGLLDDRFYDNYSLHADYGRIDRLEPGPRGGRVTVGLLEDARYRRYSIMEANGDGDIVWHGGSWAKCLKMAYFFDDEIYFAEMFRRQMRLIDKLYDTDGDE